MNLLAVLAAAFLQFRWAPFAQMDANLAEGLTLISTVLILVIGLGQQAVGGPGNFVQDQLDVGDDDDDDDDGRDQEVLDGFLMFCYVIMGTCIFAAGCVIMRRLGGVWFMIRAEFDSKLRLTDDVVDVSSQAICLCL